MQWVLIFTGFFLIVIGVYLKYQYLQISNPVLGVEATDDYKEKNRKLTNVNRELDQLIQSIDEKEEILKEKIDKFLHLEEILQEKIDEKSPSIESEDLNFKEILSSQNRISTIDETVDEKLIIDNPEEKVNNRYREVLQLAREGMEVEKIARKLNLGIRETGLILKLYRKEEDTIV